MMRLCVALMKKRKQLNTFTAFYGQLAIIFPYVVVSPRFFSGKIPLGEIFQTASAFGQVQGALSWFINDGRAAGTDLSDLAVAMAGAYDDDESGSPWRVALYVDERADEHYLSFTVCNLVGHACVFGQDAGARATCFS